MEPKNFILTSYQEYFNSRYPELAGETTEYSISEITPVDYNDREQIIHQLGGFIGEFSTREEAEKYLAAMLLGRSTSPAKATAARENGRKGGRPKGHYITSHLDFSDFVMCRKNDFEFELQGKSHCPSCGRSIEYLHKEVEKL